MGPVKVPDHEGRGKSSEEDDKLQHRVKARDTIVWSAQIRYSWTILGMHSGHKSTDQRKPQPGLDIKTRGTEEASLLGVNFDTVRCE